MNDRIAVAGSIAQKPHQAGHTWQFLQYLLGLRRLGFDVLFLDRLTQEMVEGPIERSSHAAYLSAVMERFGLGDCWALLHDDDTLGLSRDEVLRRVRSSLVLFNVMGFVDDADVLAAAPKPVFLDTDPGYGQMWRELGLADVFGDHDAYVTIAERIGQPGCTIPTCGIDWVTTSQPVVLDEWTPSGRRAIERFTSVGAWRGPYAPLEFRGETYGQRVHEFRRFLELPVRTGAAFEVALDIDPGDHRDIASLRRHGWALVDPGVVSSEPESYRAYIEDSAAELMVARGMYVKAQCGWFSERSMCYLASGKPVLAQDTGIRDLYPTGEGLIAFSTLDEAVAGVETIRSDYARHSRAAREIAEEHFDSDKVLTRLLERLGVA